MGRKMWMFVFLAFSILALVIAGNGGRAEAQCGSSMSSCKNCHEVQGQDPVSNKGAWHQQHAFGDFCEFCHAGNAQAKDKDAAHQGMVDPMADVKASCQGCHPDDYMKRAKSYATTLGVELKAGGGGAAPSAGAGKGGGTAPPAGKKGGTAVTPSTTTGVVVPKGGKLIDYNKLYQVYLENREGKRTPGRGNLVLLAIDILLLFVFIGVVWRLEGWGPRLLAWWQQEVVMVTPGAGAVERVPGRVPMPSWSELAERPKTVEPSLPTELEALFRRRPELQRLWPELVRADAPTLEAVARVLQNKETREALRRLSQIDPTLIVALRGLNDKERALLFAMLQ